MVINSYNVVNVTGKGFDQLTNLISKAKGISEDTYTSASWSRLQDALAHATSIKASDAAATIANAYDKLKAALNKLIYNHGFKVSLSHDSLEAATGQDLFADVFVPAPGSEGPQYESVCGIAALYDAGRRMVAYEIVEPTITTALPVSFSMSLSIPEDTTGLTYKFFLWNAETMVPLIDSTSLGS